MSISVIDIISGIAGGIIGTVIGGLNTFIIFGLLVMFGSVAAIAGCQYDFFTNMCFGAFIPASAFVGGCAAAAYAAKKGLKEGFSAKDIGAGLSGFNNPMTLVVGAVFGGIGMVLFKACAGYLPSGFTDNIALPVFILNAAARIIWGNGLFGKPSEEAKARGVFKPGGSNVWLPWQQNFSHLLFIGFGFSTLASVISYLIWKADPVKNYMPAYLIVFGLAAFYLIFSECGVQLPVVHHITVIASLAAITSGSVLVGIIFGMISCFGGELVSRLFYIHGDTHIDPPATIIWPMTILVYVTHLAHII